MPVCVASNSRSVAPRALSVASGCVLAEPAIGGEGFDADAVPVAVRLRARTGLESFLSLSLAMPRNLGKPLPPRIARKNEVKWAPERGLRRTSQAISTRVRPNGTAKVVLSN